MPAAITIVFGLLLFSLYQRERAIAQLADRAHYGSEILTRAYSSLKDVENLHRAYTVTGDESFLAEHSAAVSVVADQFRDLRALVTSPAEANLVARLDSLAQERISHSFEVIEARRESGMDSAASIIAAGHGRRIMNEFGREVAALAAWLDRFRDARDADYKRRSRMLYWIIGIGAVLSAGSAFGSSWGLLRYGRSRDTAARLLQASNEQLQDQAAELEAQASELEVQAVELEESADALRRKEELFRALVENANDVMVIVTADAEITYASGSMARVLGYAPGQVIGTNLMEFVHPDDIPSAECAFAEIRARTRKPVTRELRLRHAHGQWCLLEGTARNMIDDPCVAGIILNCHDVTEERVAQGQLRQSQKMEAVGRLAGGIAHDFNNLLTSIIGHAELALAELNSDDVVHEDVKEIRKAGNVASTLTRQLLAFSRQQVLRPEILNVSDVVQTSVGMLRRLIGTNVELRTRTADDIGNVLVDGGQLHQVILNLVVNARDALTGGGTITIETSNAELSDEYVAKGHPVKAGPYVLLSVSDTGQGMTEEVRNRIFEPFFTTKEQGKGTGLGLSTTYGIVKQSGGYIWVYSEPGHGTIFKVYLPRVGVERGVQIEVAEAPAIQSSGETILIVDDEASVRSYATKVLARAGYDVLEASGGPEALVILGDRAADIRLIITDVMMPKMSGTLLARTVTEHHPGIHLLFTSGYPHEEMSSSGQLPANVAFLEKPYTPAQLLASVRTAMA